MSPVRPGGSAKPPLSGCVGLAGWSEAVAKQREYFPREGSGLTRYAGTFSTVEVNASFYRAVRAETFASWAEQTPDGFRFSVKINRAVTHAARLSANARLEHALEPMMSLGPKLAAVLVQLPPTLAFEADRDEAFLDRLRALYAGMVAWEPRHPSWEGADASALLAEHGITTVRTEIPAPDAPAPDAPAPDAPAPDAPAPDAPAPDAPAGGTYVRLHGTPRRYYSAYSASDLAALATWLRVAPTPTVVIFDNTASSAGVRNALELIELTR